nr:MAG TPA: antigen S-antigen protein [Caudoviricetes sp.]
MRQIWFVPPQICVIFFIFSINLLLYRCCWSEDYSNSDYFH